MGRKQPNPPPFNAVKPPPPPAPPRLLNIIDLAIAEANITGETYVEATYRLFRKAIDERKH
jgi:hypothetical protein